MDKSLLAQFFLWIPLVFLISWGPDFQKGRIDYATGDYATALKEWKHQAEQGDAGAQKNLGLIYAFSQGALKGSIYVHKRLNVAASSGDCFIKDSAKESREVVVKKMTPQQLAEA